MKLFIGRKLILLLTCVSFMLGAQLNFKETSLKEMKLQGIEQKISYKNNDERDEHIGKLWEEFLSSTAFSSAKDFKKIYVVYTNYKKGSLRCFIGIDSSKKVTGFLTKNIKNSNYYFADLNYTPKVKIKDIWKEIDSKKLKRDFKKDIEVYNVDDLAKSNYIIKIYLSKK